MNLDQDLKWLFWVGLIMVFALVRLVKFVLARPGKSGAQNGQSTSQSSLARLNAAAERILQQRQGAADSPGAGQRSQANAAGVRKAASRLPTTQHKATLRDAATQRGKAAMIDATRSPAVVRRGGLFAGREPVIQRRR